MIDVTCAVIRNEEGLVLVVRRGPGMDNAGKWEFPGGKTLQGEEHEDCILREIDEELGMHVIITGSLDRVEHDYGDRQIRLIPFICETLGSGPMLREHDQYRWVEPLEAVALDMTAADIPVAMQYASGHNYTVTSEQERTKSAVTAEAGEDLARMMGRVSSVEEITMIARSAVADTFLMSQLVTLSSSTEDRVGFMSSWALSKASDINPAALAPYLALMIDALHGVPNESVQRSFMRVLMRCDMSDIPQSHHAALINYCMAVMREQNTPVAPKAYGMEILGSFCELYPDMINEVTGLVQLVINDASGGIKSSGRKVIVRIQSIDRG